MTEHDEPPDNNSNSTAPVKPISFEKTLDELCFQWCQQQGAECAKYCFKRECKQPQDTDQTNDIRQPPSLRDVMSYYVTDPLKNYSFIITKGKVNTASPSNQTAGTTSAEQSSANQPALEPSSETVYNMGQAVDRVVDQAEAMAKRTQKLSKDILHTWQDGKVLGTWLNDTKYKETMFILKDRVTKMVDVAMGKYDDNKKKKRDDDNGNDEPPPSSPPQ